MIFFDVVVVVSDPLLPAHTVDIRAEEAPRATGQPLRDPQQRDGRVRLVQREARLPPAEVLRAQVRHAGGRRRALPRPHRAREAERGRYEHRPQPQAAQLHVLRAERGRARQTRHRQLLARHLRDRERAAWRAGCLFPRAHRRV